ncbi:oxidoreductase dehydrogenase signal peptide protein (plasmid) [Phenylobacterium zucineum HLK1]|uniref:Oxidoreductase dehydrogenase signal peptide protein n=1 Tax=Phenylobacterium zucineum (strain HLK1) TaxID=450851 RepID=B4RIS8_PHEZH|nr:SDR family oxidoreductase [Phenylobacterium zucineum]ACG80253.1 oxidoreductase dehydrogenase signal peptide protein [Phenylobacterium zucineum HLK1]
MNRFKGGVAVVTGGASGLGKAFAEAAVRREMKVVLADIQKDALGETVESLRSQGGDVLGVVTDVAASSSVQALAEATEQQFGPANLVFNNAGVASGGFVWESSEQDWDWLLNVNLKGVANGVRVFTPRMLAAAKADAAYEGCIVNTASMAGLLTAPGMGIYSVSKHAVVALSECLHYDLSLVTQRLRAAVLCPSYVPTNIGQSHRNRPADLANPQPLTKSQVATRKISQKDIDQGAISAEDVAELTFAAIAKGSFYVFPSPETLPLVDIRMQHIVNQTNPDLPYDQVPMLRERRDQILAALAE